jgi:hypothetical protein
MQVFRARKITTQGMFSQRVLRGGKFTLYFIGKIDCYEQPHFYFLSFISACKLRS